MYSGRTFCGFSIKAIGRSGEPQWMISSEGECVGELGHDLVKPWDLFEKRQVSYTDRSLRRFGLYLNLRYFRTAAGLIPSEAKTFRWRFILRRPAQTHQFSRMIYPSRLKRGRLKNLRPSVFAGGQACMRMCICVCAFQILLREIIYQYSQNVSYWKHNELRHRRHKRELDSACAQR